MRLFKKPQRLLVEGVGHFLHNAASRLIWKFAPRQLFLNGIGAVDHEPMVHGTRWAGTDAAHTQSAERGVNNVVSLVADGLGRTSGLAGIAPNTGFGVDQVLPKWRLLRANSLHHASPHRQSGRR